LTALRLDVGAVSDSDLSVRLSEDLDDLERTVDHIIHEARRQVREGPGVVTDLGRIVRERLEFWGALAEDQGRRWWSHIDPGRLLTTGHAGDIAAALDALLANVLAHTPDSTSCTVELRHGGDFIVLTVEDQGPGFADPALIDRGASSSGSTGLGLDIVRRTAEASGGDIALSESAGGGALVVVRFGRIAG
jgi:signal transduction histidine kinase